MHAWAMAKLGKSDEEIAAAMNLTLADAQRSLLSVYTWIVSNDSAVVDARANEEVLIGLEGTGRALQEAKRATRLIALPVFDDAGNIVREAITVPDHATRLDAVRATADVIEKVRARNKGIAVNVGIQNNLNNSSGEGNRRSFEQRIRDLRERRGLRNVDETRGAFVPDDDEIMDAEDMEAGMEAGAENEENTEEVDGNAPGISGGNNTQGDDADELLDGPDRSEEDAADYFENIDDEPDPDAEDN